MKKLIIILVCVALLFSIPVNALATNTDGLCRMQYYITDTTNGEFKDEITITLYNKTVDVTYTFKATKVDYTWHYPIGGYVLEGTYIMTIDYFSKDEYTIENADGSKLTYLFHTFDDFMNYRWLIVKNDTEDNDSSPSTSKEDVTHGEYESSEEDVDYEYNKSEADILFAKFTALIEPITLDENYSSLFFEVNTEGYTLEKIAKKYEEYTDGTAEDFKNLPLLERYVWWSTYYCARIRVDVRPIKKYDDWDLYVMYVPRAVLYDDGTQEMVRAYEELMEWSYKYYAETGEVYDFVGIYKSEGNDFSNISIPENVETTEPITENITHGEYEGSEEVSNEDEVNDDHTKEGIWDDTIDSLKNNAITIIILIVLVAIAVGMWIYRKKITLK